MKRLIKSEFLDGINTKNRWESQNSYIQIFINPTSDEINEVKNDSRDNSVRGIIINDNIYIWDGSILHDYLNYSNFDINNGFRFAYYDEWEFNTLHKYSYKEAYDIIMKYKNFFEQIGSLNKDLVIGYTSDEDNNEATFKGINNLEKFVNEYYEVKVSKLIKSDYVDTVTRRTWDNELHDIEIFKNPTTKEVSDVKKESGNNSVRGLIDNNVYIWNGNILHDFLNHPNINVNNGFRFAYYDRWEFNDPSFTLEEIYNTIIEHNELLKNIGDFNKNFTIVYDHDQIKFFSNFNKFEGVIKSKVKVSRLVKSDYFDTVTRKTYEDEICDIEIFKNPTTKEVLDVKKESQNGIIRD